MAFEMTHLRFAADLAPRLGVKDMPTYLAGAIYPDSRYVTGIKRDLTHGDKAPRNPFDKSLDDFRKGWATHEFYDEQGIEKYKALSPWPENRIVGFSQEWIFTTAEKIVEDLASYDAGTVDADMIRRITPPSPVNGEDPGLLKKYFDDIRKVYAKRPEMSDYRRILSGWNIDPQIIDRLIAKTEEHLKDKTLTEKITRIYSEIINLNPETYDVFIAHRLEQSRSRRH